jgi:uncharacterized CHY-type Zn-finger protein
LERAVPSDNDLLFGKIAFGKGYCTQDQIDSCLVIQSTSRDASPLGRILVNEGYLTEQQHSEVLALQRKTMAVATRFMKKRKESILFGKLAVREGLLTEVEARDCLRIQAAETEKRSLGEIMVSKGYLTSELVKSLLAKQQKKIMSCPVCRLSFTVLTISREKRIDCPRCRGPLAEGKPSDSTRTDAEFATHILRAAKKEIPAGALGESRVFPPEALHLQMNCTICGHAFDALIDTRGRVRCPSCHSSFVPK